MDEKRLIEIASEILKHDGPLGRMAYIASLNEKDISLLYRHISSSKYEELNLYDKILTFAQEYLKSKNISLVDSIGEEKDKTRCEQNVNSYLDFMLTNDKDIQLSINKTRK